LGVAAISRYDDRAAGRPGVYCNTTNEGASPRILAVEGRSAGNRRRCGCAVGWQPRRSLGTQNIYDRDARRAIEKRGRNAKAGNVGYTAGVAHPTLKGPCSRKHARACLRTRCPLEDPGWTV